MSKILKLITEIIEAELKKFDVAKILQNGSIQWLSDKQIADLAKSFFAKSGYSNTDSIKNLSDVVNFITSTIPEKSQKYIALGILSQVEKLRGKTKSSGGLSKPVITKYRSEEDPASRILGAIHDKLNLVRVKNNNPQENYKEFAAWVKKNYPEITSPTDDTPTTLVKYADFFSSGAKILQGKSWIEDISLFMNSKTSAKTLKTFEFDPPKPVDIKSDKYITTSGLDDAETVETIAQAIGASSAKTVTNILRAIPAGKTHALHTVLSNIGHDEDQVTAKRSLGMFLKIFNSAMVSAQKEFIMLIEDALNNGDPTDEILHLSDLVDVLSLSGLREDLTENELKYENMGLERLVQIVNNHDYTDDQWQTVVQNMLKSDLLANGNNIFKSFQNLLAKALGSFDPASIIDKSGRPNAATVTRKDEVQKQFGKYTLKSDEKRGDK